MRIEALVKRFSRKFTSDALATPRLTSLESQAVALVEAPNTERTAAGRRYMGGTQVIASGIAPVTAIPTTTATLFLYNTAPDQGKCLVIDQIGHFLGSGTPTAGATLLVTITNGKPASVPAAASNYTSQSCSGFGTSVARWATGITIPAGSAWVQATSSFQLAAANVGQGDYPAFFNGGLVIPPGYGLGIAILSGTGTTPLYSVSATWDELELDLVQ